MRTHSSLAQLSEIINLKAFGSIDLSFFTTGVVGPVGSGKSALLLSMIGDLRQISGSVERRWNLDNDASLGVGYVGQEAWLLKGENNV